MCNKLFDSVERTDTGPADYSEPNYQYLNRSNRKLFQKVRITLEGWFDEFKACNPDSVKDLWKRFRSKRNEHHLAALTELYLHHFLLESGFQPLAHPELKDVATKPEFYAIRDKKPHFVVEAVLVYDEKVSARVDKFEANISDAINAVNSPDFLISFDIDSRDPNTQPKLGSITKLLQSNIDKLQYEQVRKEYEETEKLPKWTYAQGNWKLKFTASHVTEEGRIRRNDKSRVIGATGHGATLITLDTAIRDNVRAKCKKYGKFNMPFIIVVNVIRDSIFCDDDMIMEAIWGKDVCHVTLHEDGTNSTNPGRDRNGIWINPRTGVSNTHVSGLLFLSGLSSGTIYSATPVLWHHPRATHPLEMSILDIEQRYFDKESGQLTKHNVKS